MESEQNRRVSILSFDGNDEPYCRRLYRSLADEGASVEKGSFSWRWIVANRKRFDCVHINWPSFLYSDNSKSIVKLLKEFVRFIGLMMMLRLYGVNVYWTAHNLFPHDPCPLPWVDLLGRRFVIGLARKVFVHGPMAKEIVAEKFPFAKNKLVLVDHGHWLDSYPKGCSREEARRRIGLETDEYVFLFIGICKPYKNIHGLIRTFKYLKGNTKLVIAGAFQCRDYYREISRLVEEHPFGRVVLKAGYISDSDIQYYLAASDAIVLPYLDVLTSGAAILSLSFGRPVVAPRRGHLIDLVTSECGVLYDPKEVDGLLLAMRKVMLYNFDEKHIIGVAARHDWERTARKMIDAFQED